MVSTCLNEFFIYNASKSKNTLFDLKMLNVTPIIAHPERYKPVQKDINFLSKFQNCLISDRRWKSW